MPQYKTRNGGSLHYEAHGNGDKPMLLLHGLSQSGVTFKGLLPALTASRTVYLVDLPGHGRSYRPQRYQADAMIEDVTGLLRDEIGQPATVYGHSLGSLIATGLATSSPDLVSELILSDPPLVVWDEERWPGSIISSYFGWARKTLNAGYEADRIVPMLQGAFPHRPMHVLEDQAQALAQLDVGILDALFNDELTSLDEVLSRFEELRCRTLLLQADPRILAAASDEDITAIQARVRDAQHVKFAGADHDLHLWKQQPVLDAVLNFLDG